MPKCPKCGSEDAETLDWLESKLVESNKRNIDQQLALEKAEKALRAIAEHEHCKSLFEGQHDSTMAGIQTAQGHYGWQIGVREGHRCAASIAQKYFEEKK